MKYIYKITNKKTKQIYVGSTTVLPMNRWADHFRMLKVNKHKSNRFQNSWNKTQKLSDWICEILEDINDHISTRKLQYIEATYITSVPDEMRLNEPHRTTQTKDIRDKVIELLKTGEKQYLIAKKVGVCPATISVIKKEECIY